MGDTMYGEGTMPRELAIRIEMEYRRKLAQKQQIPEAEFCKNLRPFGVGPPMSGPSLGSHQRPSSNATPPLPKLQGPNHDLKSSSSAFKLRPCPIRSADVSLEIPLRQQQGPNNQFETSRPMGLGNFQNHNLRPFGVQPPMSGPSHGSHQRPSFNANPPFPKLQGPNHELKSSQPASSSELGQLQPLISASSLRPCPSRSSDVSLEIPLRQQQGPNSQLETSQPVGLGNLQNHNDYTFCKICQVPCSGFANYTQHMEGRKHKNKKLELDAGIADAGARESPRKWCETCKLWCMNEEQFQVHQGGKPHIQKLAAEKDNGKQLALVHGGPRKVSNGGRHRCHLCNIGCIDSLSLEMHKNGKRHIAQLHQSQNKKTRI